MKKTVFPATIALIILISAAMPGKVRAEGSPFKIGVGGGALFYALLGPRSITSFPLKIEFDKKALKVGGTGGVEGLYYPAPRHSISVGAFYEQRRIDLKIVNLAFFGLSPLALLSSFLPLESLVGTTRLSTHYLNFPVTYRFHPMEFFYLGAGFDVAALLKARADYRVIILDFGLDLKKYFRAADPGVRVLAGFTVKGVYGELAAGVGLLDIDTWGGARRSFYVKGTVGYRFL